MTERTAIARSRTSRRAGCCYYGPCYGGRCYWNTVADVVAAAGRHQPRKPNPEMLTAAAREDRSWDSHGAADYLCQWFDPRWQGSTRTRAVVFVEATRR